MPTSWSRVRTIWFKAAFDLSSQLCQRLTLRDSSHSRAVRVPATFLIVRYTANSCTQAPAQTPLIADKPLGWITTLPAISNLLKLLARGYERQEVLVRRHMTDGVDLERPKCVGGIEGR